MESFFTSIKFWKFASISILLSALMHVAFINLPPTGSHVWRQCNSLAISKNFYQEDMNILLPRVDKRNDETGVTGTNFPLYEWGLAVVYKVVGFHHYLHRVYAFLIGILNFLLIYLVFRVVGEQTGRKAAWIFLFSPMVFYYGFSALPDMLAIALVLAANVMVIKMVNTSKWQYLLPFFILLSLGLLIKYTFILWLAIPFLMIDSKNIKPQLPKIILGVLLTVFPVVAWYLYANHLTAISGGLVEFIYTARMVNSFEQVQDLLLDMTSTLPELFFGYPALILLIQLLFFKKKIEVKIHWFYGFGAMLASVIYFAAASFNLLNHAYYLLPFLGFALLFLAKTPVKYNKMALILILLMPIWAYARIAPSNWFGEKSDTLEQEKIALKKIIKPTDRVVCGPDETGCYLFYMLETKGFPYYRNGHLEEIDHNEIYLERVIKRGVNYLITKNIDDLNNPILTPFYQRTFTIGNEMWLIELKNF